MGTSSRIARTAARSCLGTFTLIVLSCAPDFSTARTPAPPATLGRILYSVVCDRVGAQSLPTDVTGGSFSTICHPDAKGAYGQTVDVKQLPPLQDPAYTESGQLVPLAQQQASRAYEIARVEALGRDREALVAALDAAFPDVKIPVVPPPPGPAPCAPPPSASNVSMQSDLGLTMSRLLDLYDDPDQTLPSVTRAVGRTLDDIKADPDAQAALARLDARQGYRPIPITLGAVRPLLAYPRLVELARSVVTPLLSRDTPERPEAAAYEVLTSVGYQELRSPGDPTPAIGLTATLDPKLPGRAVLSRPRTSLEATRDVLSFTSSDFATTTPDFLVQRDSRGYVAVPLVGGAVPAPFVDLTGPNGGPDGLPDVDALGRFVTSSGAPPTSPFFAPGEQDGARDMYGRAVTTSGSGSTLYGYVDAFQTALGALARDSKPFFAAGGGGATSDETAMNALAALPVLAGTRDDQAVATKVYPPDPYAVSDWKVGHTGAPPAGLGTTPVTLSYRAFHPEDSPIVDLVYALGQVAATPEMDDMLALVQQLFTSHPDQLASLTGLALEIHAIAAKHPEATLPAEETFWDDVLVKLAPVAHEPGLLEDMIRAFADPATLPMEKVLETFFAVKDDISYDTNDLNGPSIDLDTKMAPPNFAVPVDRTQPDVGPNRSEMQKFLSLLHDTNGLGICTKDGAIVHISNLNLPVIGNALTFNYPADTPTATAPNLLSSLVCQTIGGMAAPSHLDKCAVFGYENVMSLLLDVLLDKALLSVKDPCLYKLMTSSFVQGLGDGSTYGGANLFLQNISGVQGFSLQPNLRGFARLLYFETPYPGLPADPNFLNTLLPSANGGGALTSNFLADTIDPIPSMVCDPTPFTAPDGTVYALRTCKDVGDTLRARDSNALFPVDELGFVPSLRPLASAFDKHKQPLLFANLFDVLHLHWGSSKQPSTVCNPTLPRSNARWCSQDGLVTYEPLLGEVLENGVFARLQAFLADVAGMTVNHCTAFDPQTHLCTNVVTYDGIHVLAEALSLLLDPARTPGLVDRTGSAFAQRNDGQKTDPLTGMNLLVQGFTAMDRAFASYAGAHPGDTSRRPMWLAARSRFVDTFLTVNGQGAQAKFANPTLIDIIPQAVGALREQIAANCVPGAPCAWAQQELTSKLSDTLRGPSFAAAVDLLDALRQNNDARAEIERLVTYLLDSASGNDAQAGSLASALDLLQVLADDTNLPPFEKVLARTIAPPVKDEAGKVVQRSLAEAGLRSLTRIFELDVTGTGASACSSQRDPNRAIGVLLKNLVTPMGSDQPLPLSVLMDVIADVNRSDPHSTAKFAAVDYGNVANEMSQFCFDSTRGLEQFYAVIHQVTGGSGSGQ